MGAAPPQPFPAHFRLWSGFRSGRVCRTFYTLGSTPTITISKGLNKFCLVHFRVCTASGENPQEEASSRGQLRHPPLVQPRYTFVMTVLETPMRKDFLISSAVFATCHRNPKCYRVYVCRDHCPERGTGVDKITHS